MDTDHVIDMIVEEMTDVKAAVVDLAVVAADLVVAMTVQVS